MIVVKIGGGDVLDPQRRARFAADLAGLVADGRRVVVVHGGGPQATALTKRLGLEVEVVGGRRVTSPEVLEVAKMTLAGQVSVDLTVACRVAGVPAIGVAGASGLVSAVKRPPRVVSGSGGEPVDFGEVGDVVDVDRDALERLVDAGFVPVMSSLCCSTEGRVLNINADVVACELAIAVGASALVLLTGANGVLVDLEDDATRFATLTVAEGRALIADGTVVGGMIPKLEEAFRVLDAGVERVCILPAQVPDVTRRALAGSTDLGTTLRR